METPVVENKIRKNRVFQFKFVREGDLCNVSLKHSDMDDTISIIASSNLWQQFI
jgi:hypothetical protein